MTFFVKLHITKNLRFNHGSFHIFFSKSDLNKKKMSKNHQIELVQPSIIYEVILHLAKNICVFIMLEFIYI